MELTLGDVVSRATTMAGRSDFSTSEVSFWANLALTEVSNRLPHKPKEAVAYSNIAGTGGEREITLPTDFDGTLGVKYYSTSTTTLGVLVLGDEVDMIEVDTTLIDSFSSVSGTPIRYAIYGDNLELDPIPDSAGSLVMRYLAKQVTLVNLSESPDLDERWHPGWLNKTEEYVHRARGNTTAAAEAERRYVNYMISTPNDRALKQADKHGLGLWVRKS